MNLGRRLERVLATLPECPARAAQQVARVGQPIVAAEAEAHGLIPLLGYYLPGVFPVDRATRLSAQFGAARTERATVGSVAVLANAGIIAIALKGAVLAHQLYPEPWLRPSADIDLLLDASQVDAAVDVLRVAGWMVVADPRSRPLDYQHSVNMLGPGNQLMELHYALSSSFQAAFEWAGLFERSRTILLTSGSVRVLGAVDDLLHQCLHAAAHTFEGVKWLYDLKLTLRNGDVPWGRLCERAREAKVSVAAGMALSEARRRVGATVPARVIAELGPGMVLGEVVRVSGRMPSDWKRLRGYVHDIALGESMNGAWRKRLVAPIVKRLKF